MSNNPYDNKIDIFRIDDVVLSREQINGMFYGVVIDIRPKENKVYVDWGGVVKQENPSDIMLWPYEDKQHITNRLAGELVKIARDLLKEGE